MRFYPGLHQPSDAHHFRLCCLSVKRLRGRRTLPGIREWIMDSGAFSELKDHGRFLLTPKEYATEIRRWWHWGYLAAAVSQDFMCEPFILAKTGLTTEEHQSRTIEHYDALRSLIWPLVYIMPVLQGYWPEEYVRHLGQYGNRLRAGQWVGVGSVCKRNARVEEIEQVIVAIKRVRPDLKLHGFGVKKTALASSIVRDSLHSADSMAWSYAARRKGRNANDWQEAQNFVNAIEGQRTKRRVFQGRLF